MSSLQSIISSFHLQDNLNPKVWETKGSSHEMRPKVRQRLLEITNIFIEFLDVDIIVSDVIMTGSLANYNWSKFSDVDLHIMVDFDQFSEEELPLYKELFTLKKTVFNDKHDIKIFGYDVELYVQDTNEEHFSSGVYSVLNNEWINEPSKEDVKIDKALIKSKSQQWMKIIDGVIENINDESIDETKSLIKKYKDKLKKYRTCGLEEGGEYSDENLVFKVLRRNGYIEKLINAQNKHMDRKLSLKEETTNIGGDFKTDLENGPKNHGSRALGNWQSDNAWDIFAKAGTIVNSYTNGKVIKVRDTGTNAGKIYGTQVTIQGDGYPDIFYTHLKNVKLKAGDKVNVGDYIGEISEWVGHDTMTHVHIGLPYGNHLRDLLSRNQNKIFSGKESEIKKDNGDTKVSDEKTLGDKLKSSLSNNQSDSLFSDKNLIDIITNSFGKLVGK